MNTAFTHSLALMGLSWKRKGIPTEKMRKIAPLMTLRTVENVDNDRCRRAMMKGKACSLSGGSHLLSVDWDETGFSFIPVKTGISVGIFSQEGVPLICNFETGRDLPTSEKVNMWA